MKVTAVILFSRICFEQPVAKLLSGRWCLYKPTLPRNKEAYEILVAWIAAIAVWQRVRHLPAGDQ